MFCFNGDSCHERHQTRPYWTGSAIWAPQMAQGGIFDDKSSMSGFADANLVYVKYCSSDLWSGDVPASQATWSFAFRGARIVSAVITSLVADKGMGAAPGTRLLFGGCSAGAIGAMNNLDAVTRALAVSAPSVQVQGLLDAAALVDIAPAGWPWSPDLIPLQQLIAALVAGIMPTFDPSCAALYTGADAWKCLFGQYRMPLLSTPFFMNGPQFDDFEIMYDTDNMAPSTPEQLAFVNSFQPAVLALIDSLPPGTGVFSPTCLAHCLSGQTTYDAFTIGGQSMEQAVMNWWQGQPTRVVSPCTGWACVNECGATSNGLPCNMGTEGCTALVLPTSLPNEPAPAAPAPQQAQAPQGGSSVQEQEPSLSPEQQASLQQLQAQQSRSASRRLLAAAETCCGRHTGGGAAALA
jgi:hypothetical protein